MERKPNCDTITIQETKMYQSDLFAQSNDLGANRNYDHLINLDGTSVKGCTIIYGPAGQAGEYSALATNPYSGCGHKCAYCYVPNVLRITREQFDLGATLRNNFLSLLAKDAAKYKLAKLDGQVMLSFTTDPYHPFDNTATKEVIQILQNHGLGVCTLTKGGSRALRDIKLFRPNKDAFASTLTSLDDTFSQKWERGAALPMDRINTLKKFYEAGIFTWVSLEPTLDTESSKAILKATHKFVNLFKIGRANYLPITHNTDWQSYTHAMVDICNKLQIKHYIKKDLQPYLPKDYYNPLRIIQHN